MSRSARRRIFGAGGPQQHRHEKEPRGKLDDKEARLCLLSTAVKTPE
jgi:hypothetical protein